jgi:hypothetical protein
VKPPREIEIYEDAEGGCPFDGQWSRLAPKVQARVGGRKDLLRKGEWDYLMSREIVKHLDGNIFELKVKGSGVFGVRVFFFMETCRGLTECVFTELDERSALNKLGKFQKYIERAEAMRLDWQQRHCGGRR